MAVHSKPKKSLNDIDLKAAERFMQGTDNPATGIQPTKTKKIPIALRFDAELLSAIDAMAIRRGMSRNAIISYWCSKGVEAE